MPPEPKKWVKVSRRGRMKGVEVQIDQETWENALTQSGIPLDTPLEEIRVTRYMTRSRNILLRVQHISKIPKEDLM